VTAMLPRPQWTLLNLLNREMGFMGRRGAHEWLKLVDGLDLDGMLALEDARMVEARFDAMGSRRPGNPEHGAPQPLPKSGDIPTNLSLHLIERGWRWLDRSPHNKVLRAAAAHTVAVELGKAVRRGRLNLEAVVECREAGYVDLVWMANDRPVKEQTAEQLKQLLAAAGESLQAVGLVATRTGRTVYGDRS
jgi:hypothetical protein